MHAQAAHKLHNVSLTDNWILLP